MNGRVSPINPNALNLEKEKEALSLSDQPRHYTEEHRYPSKSRCHKSSGKSRDYQAIGIPWRAQSLAGR